MSNYCLDASFIINYLNGVEKSRNFIEQLEKNDRILIPIIAKSEVKYSQKDIGRFEEIDTVKFADKDLKLSIKIVNHLEEFGDRISLFDTLIAAQSVKSDSTLVTFDQDFEKLEKYPRFEYKKLSAK